MVGQIPHSGDLNGFGVQKKVHLVKVVAALVELQTVGAGTAAVPAAEVAGSVFAVQHFGVLHAEHLTDDALVDHFLDFQSQGAVTGVVAGHCKDFRIPCLGVTDLFALFSVDAEGLF